MWSKLSEQSKDMLLVMLQYVMFNSSIRQDERRPGTATMCRIPYQLSHHLAKHQSRDRALSMHLVLSEPFSVCRVPLPKRFLLIGPCTTVSGLVKWKQDSKPHFQYPLEVNICLSRWEEIKQSIQHKQCVPWQTVICLQSNNPGHQSNQHFCITRREGNQIKFVVTTGFLRFSYWHLGAKVQQTGFWVKEGH